MNRTAKIGSTALDLAVTAGIPEIIQKLQTAGARRHSAVDPGVYGTDMGMMHDDDGNGYMIRAVELSASDGAVFGAFAQINLQDNDNCMDEWGSITDEAIWSDNGEELGASDKEV